MKSASTIYIHNSLEETDQNDFCNGLNRIIEKNKKTISEESDNRLFQKNASKMKVCDSHLSIDLPKIERLLPIGTFGRALGKLKSITVRFSHIIRKKGNIIRWIL